DDRRHVRELEERGQRDAHRRLIVDDEDLQHGTSLANRRAERASRKRASFASPLRAPGGSGASAPDRSARSRSRRDAPSGTPAAIMAPPGRPPITADDVRRIARLAHLDVSPDDIVRLTRELGDILAYVRQLEEIDTAGVAPTAYGELDRLAFRGDEP